jgi:hypothetical protein
VPFSNDAVKLTSLSLFVVPPSDVKMLRKYPVHFRYIEQVLYTCISEVPISQLGQIEASSTIISSCFSSVFPGRHLEEKKETIFFQVMTFQLQIFTAIFLSHARLNNV